MSPPSCSRSSVRHLGWFGPRVALTLAAVVMVAACAGEDGLLGPNQLDIGVEGSGSGTAPEIRTQWLTNGDVEAASGDSPVGWTHFVGTDTASVYDFEWSSTTARSGQRSLKISHATADSSFGSWFQGVDVSGLTGSTLTLTAWVKLEGVSGNGFALVLRADGGGDMLAFATTPQREPTDHNTGTGDWRLFEVEIEVVPEGVERVLVFPLLLTLSDGTVYIDDITLSSSEGTPRLTVQNGDVELGTGAPKYWWGYTPSGYQRTWTTQASSSPEHSLMIAATAAQESSFSFWAQTFQPDDFLGGSVTLSAKLKLDGVQGDGISIVVRGDDTSVPRGRAEVFVTTQGDLSLVGTHDWLDLSVTLPNVPAGIRSLTVYLVYLPKTTGTAYFDDISTR